MSACNSQSCWCCAGVALLTGVANWLYIEPVATDLMFERYALENAEGERDGAKIKALYKQFGTDNLHLFSVALNICIASVHPSPTCPFRAACTDAGCQAAQLGA